MRQNLHLFYLKKSKKMKQFILLILIAFSFALPTQAQTINSSPFHRIPKPERNYNKSMNVLGMPVNPTFKAWRFTPMTGYNLTTKQLMAGLGYGLQWMHFVDSTQKYYTTFSIKAVGWLNGSTTPSINQPSFASGGITIGFLNELIQVGAAYTPSTPNTKSQIGGVINFAIPLNN